MYKYFILIVIGILLVSASFFLWLGQDFPQPVFSQVNFSLPQKQDQDNAKPIVKPDLDFLFTGDIMLDRSVKAQINKNGFDYIFSELLKSEPNFFNNYDLVSANLEGTVTKQGQHYPPVSSNDFAFATETVSQLKKYHFNYFTIANNHLTDQGTKGVTETSDNLKSLNFNFSGCPDAQTGQCSSTIIQTKGYRIGLVGLSQVYKLLDTTAAVKIVSDLNSTTDYIIVNIHWGTEYEHDYNKTQQNIAHALIDAGADLIIGHHPHVIQGIEIYQHKPIFYSLGNLIFDQYFSVPTQQALIVAANINANQQIISLTLYPLKSVRSQLQVMTEAEKNKIFTNLTLWSPQATDYHEQIKKGLIRLKISDPN